MKGANEFHGLFQTGQYNRLYIVSGSHARGSTFYIYVLPEGEAAISNGCNNGPLNKDAVCVYGIKGGNPGWTEWYGWLHEGPWQRDFYELVKKKQQEREAYILAEEQSIRDKELSCSQRVSRLLSTYK